MGCAGAGCMDSEPQVPPFGEPCTHVAVKVKVTE